MTPGLDSSVWAAGGLATVVAAIALPLWRVFIAKQATATDVALGEASWIKRMGEDLATSRAVVAEMVKLRESDAQLIAALKLDKAMSIERSERMVMHMRRLEEMLVELKPELATWIRADFIEIPERENLRQLLGPQ